MKQYLSIVLALICVVLVIAFIVVKQGDDTQHETDAGAITDFSNQLDSAQIQISTYVGTVITISNSLDETSNNLVAISNSLDECQAASSAFSNNLVEAESTIALDAEQITNLSRQIADSASENQTLSQHVMDLTNQIDGLTNQIALTETNLAQANIDYALLENRFRIDVAERAVVERKFYNLSELKAQIQELKEYPDEQISAESIYAGLDVEVKSNTFHVISPN
jgi:chromosome segregation ATPase